MQGGEEREQGAGEGGDAADVRRCQGCGAVVLLSCFDAAIDALRASGVTSAPGVEEALKAKEPPVMEPPAKKPRGISRELASLNGSQQPLPPARGNVCCILWISA